MRRRRRTIEDLRTAIDCLPMHTRVAMLEGVRRWPIIVGAYTDRQGGVCPMLAAHRCGGRTDLLAFAHAWDRFTGARRRARRATEREPRAQRPSRRPGSHAGAARPARLGLAAALQAPGRVRAGAGACRGPARR